MMFLLLSLYGFLTFKNCFTLIAGQGCVDGYADVPDRGGGDKEESGDENQNIRARSESGHGGERRRRAEWVSGLQNQPDLGRGLVWGLDHAFDKRGSSGLLAQKTRLKPGNGFG